MVLNQPGVLKYFNFPWPFFKISIFPDWRKLIPWLFPDFEECFLWPFFEPCQRCASCLVSVDSFSLIECFAAFFGYTVMERLFRSQKVYMLKLLAAKKLLPFIFFQKIFLLLKICSLKYLWSQMFKGWRTLLAFFQILAVS